MKATSVIIVFLLSVAITGCKNDDWGIVLNKDQTFDMCLRKELFDKCQRTTATVSQCDALAMQYSVRLKEHVEPKCRRE